MSERLGDDNYVKPLQTFTDRLSQDEINKLLEDYVKENIKNIVKGSHVRYFSKDKDGNLKFRLGGMLINTDGLPEYVVLSNGKKNWSVQVKDTIFYGQISNKQLKKEYKDLLFKQEHEIESFKNSNKSLLTINSKLEKNISEKDKKINSLNKQIADLTRKNDVLKKELYKLKNK